MSALRNFRGLTAGVALLAASSVAQADFIDTWINGFYEDSGNRRGLGLNYIPTGPEAGVLFAAYYTYDEATGAPIFVQGAAPVVAGDFEVEIPINFVEGGSFGSESGSPGDVGLYGTATLTFNSCNSITWAMEPAGSDFTAFSNPLVSFFTFGLPDVPNSECVYQQEFDGCPDFAVEGTTPRTCVIPGGEYTQDLTLTNDTIWALGGAVYIGQRGDINNPNPGNSNTLFIEPGTRILGSGGNTLLGIQPGAKIMAEGTAEAPIVFSGIYPASNPPGVEGQVGAPGDWGGLTINGLAPINVGTALGEGESGAYGGDDPFDSSGVLRYVRVQFAGFRFNDTNELNGIAFQGVGAGTVLENIQVHANEDDGVEFFGGTVNARNIVLTDIRDDSLDWTEGWQGRVQNLLVIQNRDFEAADEGDRGIEADNLEGDNDAEPRAKPWISHATFIGRPDTTGATIRRGTGVNITNSIFTGFQNCIDLDDESTFTNGGTPDNLSGKLTIQNSIVNCETNFVEESGDPWTVQSWFEAQSGNQAIDPGLVGVFPPEGASYLRGFPVGYAGQDEGYFDSFFQNFEHIGAFSGPGAAWTQGWTLQELDFYAQ